VTDSSIIKSFLYEIGFKVDDASVAAMRSAATEAQNTLHDTEAKGDVKAESEAKKRTTRKIQDQKRQTDTAIKSTKESTEKTARGLSTMFEAVFAAIAIDEIVNTFQKITDGLDGLYWQSIRIKSSAENIKTFAYGFSQVGGSVDGAKQSLTAFSDWTKYGFGSQKLLKGWFDIDATDSKTGKLKDTVELFKEVGKGLAVLEKTKGPQYTNMIAGMMGIDTSTMQVMMRDASQFEDQQKRFYREHGIDVNAAVESAHRFKLAENELFADLGDLTDKEGGDFLKWLDDVGKKYGGQFAHIANDIGEMSKALNVLSKDFGFLGNVFDFVFKGMLGWIDAILKEFTYLAKAADDIAHGRWHDAAHNAAEAVRQSPVGQFNRAVENVESGIGKSLFGSLLPAAAGGAVGGASGGGPSGGGGSSSNGSSSSISLPGQSGTDSKSDYLNKLEKFAGIPAGALDALWSRESARGENKGFSRAGALGDFQFMQETANRFGLRDRSDFATSAQAAAKYIAELLRRYGGNSQKAFAAYNAGEKRVDQAIEWGGANWLSLLPNETQNYAKNVSLGSAPLMAGGGSSSSASINQKTEIHVHGSGDPKATANETANAQSRVNGQLLRNTQAALV
jgi:hypothetical protein